MNNVELIEKIKTSNRKLVAKETGVSYDRMAKWIAGKGNPKKEDFDTLVAYFQNGSNSTLKVGDKPNIYFKMPFTPHDDEKTREIEEIIQRLLANGKPQNEYESFIFEQYMNEVNFKTKLQKLKKTVGNVRRLAIKELDKKNRELLNKIVDLINLSELLSDTINQYFDDFNENSVPANILVGHEPIPKPADYKNRLTTELKPLFALGEQIDQLNGSITSFLQSVKPFDTNEIIYL